MDARGIFFFLSKHVTIQSHSCMEDWNGNAEKLLSSDSQEQSQKEDLG